MPRTYVDNAYNRRLGRVGMPHGTMVVSRSGNISSASYVDNAYNRNLGRVGMPHGSMPVSSSHKSSSNEFYFNNCYNIPEDSYVDNAYNRSLGRVGMPHGSMPVTKSREATKTKLVTETPRTTNWAKTYSDKHLGLTWEQQSELTVLKSSGTKPKSMSNISTKSSTNHPSKKSEQTLKAATNEQKSTDPIKTYKDNPYNRSHNRVGLPVGSKVISSSSEKATRKLYCDNSMNRKLGRAGKPLGSMPISKCSKTTEITKTAYDYCLNHKEEDINWNQWNGILDNIEQEYLQETIQSLLQREEQVQQWQQETRTTNQPTTSSQLFDGSKTQRRCEEIGAIKQPGMPTEEINKCVGKVIDFYNLEIGEKIGYGAFGDVFFAKWKGAIVAVKKLRVQMIARSMLRQFTKEVNLFCQFDHPNIVRFLGVCNQPPNFAIVMEYMQCSLFEALHYLQDFELSEDNKINIMHQTAMGVDYLHGKDIAHCDIKTSNILLDTRMEKYITAKLTDFGLSIIKVETECSASSDNFVKNVGTPRYSAPEILRGELLDLSDMKMADMYSYSLVVYEIVYECEPFAFLNYNQLRTHVGEKKLIPDIPDSVKVNPILSDQLHTCWSRNPSERPTAIEFAHCIEGITEIYEN